MRNSTIQKIISFSFILQILYSTSIFSQVTEIQITNDEHYQMNPTIWDSIIVYQDGRYTTDPYHLRDVIFIYNINTQENSLLYSITNRQTSPDVWDNKVVWMEMDDIYMFDMTQKIKKIICEAG